MGTSSPVRRLRNALRTHGPWRTARILGKRLHREFFPAPVPTHPFDLEHGMDTSGLLFAEHLASGHAHDDHIDAARSLADATGASIWLHPADQELWDMTYPDWVPDRELADGQKITVAGAELTVLHTPGHSRGAVCFHVPGQGWLFSGDTLFSGGPGATGRSFSDFPTILQSISGRLGTLPADTVVYTGHGDTTRIGDEIVHYDEWVARGH